MITTVRGKPLMVTVGYRLPFPAYQDAIARAHQEGVQLSKVLRRATLRGLEAEAAGLAVQKGGQVRDQKGDATR